MYRQTERYFPEIISKFPDCTKDSETFDVRKLDKEFVEERYIQSENKVSVLEEDSFVVARWLVEKGNHSPLVLNLASAYKPGGGWKGRGFAQEESLFFRSTYALTLDRNYGYSSVRYPLKDQEIVYSPNVQVFLDEYHKPFEGFQVSCLAVAGIRKPSLEKEHLSEKDLKLTEEKIRAIYMTALKKKHSCLVLGALGCGVYCNPPEDIANLFKKVNREFPYGLEIYFAILSVKNRKNFLTFKKILS